jgi:hypothetical protein
MGIRGAGANASTDYSALMVAPRIICAAHGEV